MTESADRKRCLKKAAFGCGLFLMVPALMLAVIVFSLILLNGRTGAETDYSGSRYLAEPPPPPLTRPITLKLVTFNIANAYLFTTNRPERVHAIGAKLTELDPDIVGLQEAFIAKDRELLYAALKDSRLKHFVRFPSAVLGNGLLILSAWPIEEAYFHRFEKSNPWYKFHEGDWWAGKGVGMARIRLPDGAAIDFYNTHAQAGRRHPTRYLEVRTSQMQGLARFVNETKCGTGPAFVLGDFNTSMGRRDMEEAVSGAHLERIMRIDTGIDHVFAVRNPRYRFEVLSTDVIDGRVQGTKGHVFLCRPPTFEEMKRIYFGPGEETTLSDHHGYMTTVRVMPAGIIAEKGN
jgi:endonuclease/exonuclease/phosphatase family metal-dependent hydrolase